LLKNLNSASDPHFEDYVKELKDRSSEDLERELAQYCFDFLFIQTQIEATQFQDEDYLPTHQSGEQRLLRLQGRIEALKRELFNRSETQAEATKQI